MTSEASARFEILQTWRNLNDMLIELVDVVPEESMDWSPKPELWSFRRLLTHLCEAREQWMTRAIADGETNVGFNDPLARADIWDALRLTWQRIERTFADQAKLDATYKDRWWDKAPVRSGHWVAFHLLEHDIHHRAELYLYMGLAGLAVPERTDVMP
jgi:uncharacterized damage-inducible protein DinB